MSECFLAESTRMEIDPVFANSPDHPDYRYPVVYRWFGKNWLQASSVIDAICRFDILVSEDITQDVGLGEAPHDCETEFRKIRIPGVCPETREVVRVPRRDRGRLPGVRFDSPETVAPILQEAFQCIERATDDCRLQQIRNTLLEYVTVLPGIAEI